MSDARTPETNAQSFPDFDRGGDVVLADFAAELERQRDAARELAESNGKLAHDTAIDAMRYRDQLKIALSALTKLRVCDWRITLPDRMDGVREIARNAIAEIEAANNDKGTPSK